MSVDRPARWAWVEVDLGAIAANVAWLRRQAAPASVWAVVKADGYGHGAVPVARAALAAGAEGLAVALVAEGAELRRAGIDAPVLVLSEPQPDGMGDVVANRLEPIVYTEGGIDAAAAAAERAGAEPLPVHLKLDTGMHRVGARPADAVALVQRIRAHSSLRLAAVCTHLAVADQPGHPATAAQLGRLDDALRTLADAGLEVPRVHAANSAATIAEPGARHSFVRAGIAVYGIPPAPGLAAAASGLTPALAFKARVSLVKVVAAGEQVSYGLCHTFTADTVVATVPLGYADGVPRRLYGTGGEVLIGGRRRPIVGVVTMDQLMVACGPAPAGARPDDPGDAASVRAGDEVVLLGRQGSEQITADEWAARLGTISYEVVCGISARVPRRHLGPEALGGSSEAGR